MLARRNPRMDASVSAATVHLRQKKPTTTKFPSNSGQLAKLQVASRKAKSDHSSIAGLPAAKERVEDPKVEEPLDSFKSPSKLHPVLQSQTVRRTIYHIIVCPDAMQPQQYARLALLATGVKFLGS